MRDKRMDGRPTDPAEQKLINVGHFLWRHRKEWPEPGISIALETIWRLKEELRVPLRKEWLERAEIRKQGRAEVMRANRKRCS